MIDKELTKWFIFQNDRLVFLKDNQTNPTVFSSYLYLKEYFLREFPIGIYHTTQCFCAEIANHISLNDNYQALPVKVALEILGTSWYGALAKAFAIINWDKNNQFCGYCGASTTRKLNAYERICSVCQLGAYPRISPSTMVLIQKADHVLLARSPHFQPGAYGLIAGFVEVGENLEETIHREVKEEVGLKIKNLKYFGSQSWPFPDSLLIGYLADYAGGKITIDNVEIIEAAWYRYDNLPGYPSIKISLARKLIDHFVNEKTKLIQKTQNGRNK